MAKVETSGSKIYIIQRNNYGLIIRNDSPQGVTVGMRDLWYFNTVKSIPGLLKFETEEDAIQWLKTDELWQLSPLRRDGDLYVLGYTRGTADGKLRRAKAPLRVRSNGTIK